MLAVLCLGAINNIAVAQSEAADNAMLSHSVAASKLIAVHSGAADDVTVAQSEATDNLTLSHSGAVDKLSVVHLGAADDVTVAQSEAADNLTLSHSGALDKLPDVCLGAANDTAMAQSEAASNLTFSTQRLLIILGWLNRELPKVYSSSLTMSATEFNLTKDKQTLHHYAAMVKKRLGAYHICQSRDEES